jgi:hypothetical protein
MPSRADKDNPVHQTLICKPCAKTVGSPIFCSLNWETHENRHLERGPLERGQCQSIGGWCKSPHPLVQIAPPPGANRPTPGANRPTRRGSNERVDPSEEGSLGDRISPFRKGSDARCGCLEIQPSRSDLLLGGRLRLVLLRLHAFLVVLLRVVALAHCDAPVRSSV